MTRDEALPLSSDDPMPRPMLTCDSGQLAGLDVVGDVAGHLAAEAEAHHVDVLEARHTQAHHRVQQLGRAVADQRHVVGGLHVAG